MNPSITLLVEDNRILAKMFGEVLQELANVALTTVHNGRDAQTFLQNNTPKTIVLDLHIPEVSGMQIIQEVTDNERFNDTQIIVMTADTFLGEKIKEWHPRVSQVLFKPIAIEILLKAIQ